MMLEAPLPAELVEELFAFWGAIFGEHSDLPPEVFGGEEGEHNRTSVYLDRQGDWITGTCVLMVSKRMPIIGGISAVATSPQFRRSGIATQLCRQAVDDFREGGGQAIFLGAGIPNADRIYHRLGWRKLAGSNVMANISNRDSPEAFLVDYFRDLRAASARTAHPQDRIPMIPLLHVPHDWQVLDSNVGMFSTRYAVQGWCMSLYRRYAAVAADGRGSWFSVVTDSGRVVGLSTARLDESGRCRVDAFAHKNHMSVWRELVQAATDWGTGRGASSFEATVSIEDEEKRGLFESIGFQAADRGEPFKIGGRQVESVRLSTDLM